MKVNLTVHPRLHLRFSLLAWILMALAGIAFVVAMVRYVAGIGAISNLNNSYPWGFWVSFDLFTGIAISSGAFIIASIIYIFELEQFRPLLRPTLVTGLLGYLMEGIALLVELGQPQRIWFFSSPRTCPRMAGSTSWSPVSRVGAPAGPLAPISQMRAVPSVHMCCTADRPCTWAGTFLLPGPSGRTSCSRTPLPCKARRSLASLGPP